MVFLQLILRDQEALLRGRGVGSLSPLLSSSPMLAAEASSAMQKLCSTAARGDPKLHGIFQLSLQLEEHGKNQQTRGVFLTPVQSFAGVCLQCLVLHSVLRWSRNWPVPAPSRATACCAPHCVAYQHSGRCTGAE